MTQPSISSCLLFLSSCERSSSIVILSDFNLSGIQTLDDTGLWVCYNILPPLFQFYFSMVLYIVTLLTCISAFWCSVLFSCVFLFKIYLHFSGIWLALALLTGPGGHRESSSNLHGVNFSFLSDVIS